MGLVKFQSDLSDWNCINSIDYSKYFINLEETWNNDFTPIKFETYDKVFDGIQVENDLAL